MHSMGDLGVAGCLAEGGAPTLLRGDVAYGSESVLREAEARDQPYLTTLRVTKNVKALI